MEEGRHGEARKLLESLTSVHYLPAPLKVTLYQLLGEACSGLNDLTAALDYLTRGHKLAGKDDPQRAELALSLANLHYDLLNLKEAVKYCEEAIQRFAQSDPIATARALNLAGLIHLDSWKLEQARFLIEEALNIRKRFKGHEKLGSGIGDSYNNLGELFRQMGDIDQAKGYYQKAQEVYATLNDKFGLAIVFNNLAMVTADYNPDMAQDFFQAAQRMFQELQTLDLEMNLDYAMFQLKCNDLAEAGRVLAEIRNKVPPGVCRLRVQYALALGVLHLLEHNPGQADRVLREVLDSVRGKRAGMLELELFLRASEASWGRYRISHDLSYLEVASDLLKHAHSVTILMKKSTLAIELQILQSLVARARGNLVQAEEFLDKALVDAKELPVELRDKMVNLIRDQMNKLRKSKTKDKGSSLSSEEDVFSYLRKIGNLINSPAGPDSSRAATT